MLRALLTGFRYGIVLGVMLGLASGLKQLLGDAHLQYRLYSLSLSALASSLVRFLGIGAAAGIVFSLMFLSSDRLRGTARTVYRAGCILILISFLYWLSGFHAAVTNPVNRVLAADIVASYRWNLLGAVACLLLGVLALKRVRRTSAGGAEWKFHAAKVFAWVGHRNHAAVFLLAVTLVTSLAAWILRLQAAASIREKPSIIFIMLDTVRADHLGCYGYRSGSTPNIDEFAEHSTMFEQAIAQAPMTSMSVGSFLTSRYPQNIVIANARGLLGIDKRLPTMAEILKDAGYRTLGVTSNLVTQRSFGFAQGFERWDESLRYTDVTSPGVREIGLRQIDGVGSRPFFSFMLFMDPHSPYVMHDEHNSYPDYRGALGKTVSISMEQSLKPLAHFSPEDIKYQKAAYDSDIAFTDRNVGELLDGLRVRGIYDQSLIVVLGDHGEEFNEHGYLLHGNSVYSGAITVPLLIKFPGQKEGRTVKGKFPLINLLPSILRYIGRDAGAYMAHGQAVNISTVRQMPDEYVFSAADAWDSKKWAVQDSRYKLIVSFDRRSLDTMRVELYDLREDPLEQRDISSANQQICHTMSGAILEKDRLVGWSSPSVRRVQASGEMKLDEKEKARLKSLGYL